MVTPEQRPRLIPRLALLVVAACAALAWSVALRPEPPLLTAAFLDVGQADCAVLRTRGGHTVVIDAGRRTGSSDAARSVLIPYLRSQGIGSVDALVLTHPDDDHVGGAPTLLRKLRVGRLLVSGLPSDAATYNEALAVARERHVSTVEVRAGQTIAVERDISIDVLSPPPGPQPPSEHASNAGSVVLLVRAGATRLLLTGDANEEAEQAMLARGEAVRADILKVGHHGSPGSSCDHFLDAVAPRTAVISVGKHNMHGHPSPAVIERLAKRGIAVFRTDTGGAITASSDGRQWRISSYRGNSARLRQTGS